MSCALVNKRRTAEDIHRGLKKEIRMRVWGQGRRKREIARESSTIFWSQLRHVEWKEKLSKQRFPLRAGRSISLSLSQPNRTLLGDFCLQIPIRSGHTNKHSTNNCLMIPPRKILPTHLRWSVRGQSVCGRGRCDGLGSQYPVSGTLFAFLIYCGPPPLLRTRAVFPSLCLHYSRRLFPQK